MRLVLSCVQQEEVFKQWAVNNVTSQDEIPSIFAWELFMQFFLNIYIQQNASYQIERTTREAVEENERGVLMSSSSCRVGGGRGAGIQT